MAKEHWYQIFLPYTPEPTRLRKLYCICFFGALITFLSAGLIAYLEQGWGARKITSELCNCPNQESFHTEMTEMFEKDKKAAQLRLEKLENIRLIPTAQSFKQSWLWFEDEISHLRTAMKVENPYRIRSLEDNYFEMLLNYTMTLLAFILIGRIVLLHANSLPKEMLKTDFAGWQSSYLFFGLLVGLPMVIAATSASVFTEEKLLLGWDSFCVSPWAFLSETSSFLFYGFVAATPFTILWCLSRKHLIPEPDIAASDGRFGVGRFVEFLQVWTLWLVLAPSTVGIIWLRFAYKNEPHQSPTHFLVCIGPIIIIFIIVIKLVRNAIILRFRCRKRIEEFGAAKADLPSDPTINFLGTDWWKLPATITVSLTILWAILNFLGLTETIKSLIN